MDSVAAVDTKPQVSGLRGHRGMPGGITQIYEGTTRSSGS